MMLKWDLDSPVTFKPGSRNSPGHTVHDFEKRFQLEDDGYIDPSDRGFRWDVINDDNLRMQIRFEDYAESGEEFHGKTKGAGNT